MARVTGVKERLHSPLYDAFFLPETPEDAAQYITFSSAMRDPSVIRFFVDVQNKTRLETNLQASGVLPSLNTFEARALRVVISGGPPAYETDTGEQGSVPVETDLNAFIPELIYSSVITFLVGEKEAITAPTYMFPSGAGVLGGNGSMPINHGEPDPLSTFRFAEPVTIECQQNFRVEMLFPRGVPETIANAIGPRHIWVVLDGYLTRDVQ
jgi:hypothetical protein